MTGAGQSKDPAAGLWQGTVALRIVTYCFAIGTVWAHYGGYARPRMAVVVVVAMGVWSAVTVAGYLRSPRSRALVIADVVVTCALMYTSVWILSPHQLSSASPLITTVWAAEPAVAAAVIGGRTAGSVAGLVVAIATGLSRGELDTDVVRDGVLLVGSGFVIGMAATTARRSAAQLARALRTEAATAERERLARSIHDSVLQVLARVSRRGSELGGEAAELAALAGEQEIALRALVASVPGEQSTGRDEDDIDLRGRLQVLATSRVHVSAPGNGVRLPAVAGEELLAAVTEALSNVDTHAGPDARAWVLLEDVGDAVVVSVRDDGPGIPPGRLAEAAGEGRLGVAKSIRARVEQLGGTVKLDTRPGEGTEWEMRVPRSPHRGRIGRWG